MTQPLVALVDEVAAGLRFLVDLPRFLRRPITIEQCRSEIRHRLDNRPSHLLRLLRTIYTSEASPYRRLLNHAGCELGDVERLVEERGAEGALESLFRSGVYLTGDEFKGRQPVVRGGLTLQVNPLAFRNDRMARHSAMQSSGTSGAPVAAGPLSLDFIRTRAANTCMMLEARQGAGWAHAVWGVPGGAPMSVLLQLGGLGYETARWFSQVAPGAPGLHPRYVWSARVMHLGGLLAGVSLPSPRHVSLDDPMPIVQWMRGALASDRVPHLVTYSSPAVRLCQAALDHGLRLDGAQITASGEALTPARRAVIERAGVRVVVAYGIAETGWIGQGCLQGEASDDLHVYEDLHAVIQPGADGASAGLPGRALLISSLTETNPYLLLNVSFGDEGHLVERACGCGMARVGWRRHLHTVRSYEKLTASGMNFLDTDVARVLEEVLPGRFGGGATDYQLVEEETDDGRARIRLLVNPSLGPLDDAAIADAFLAAIGYGSGVQRIMGLQWREARLLSVERAAPRATARGKILHLYKDHKAERATDKG